MKIDLAKDSKVIKKHIEQRIKDYPIYINEGPGKDEDDVTQITIGFQFDQSGWVAMVFDTRPKSTPDGEWNSYIEENIFEMNYWCEIIDSFYENEKPFKLVDANGEVHEISGENEGRLAEFIGDMLKQVLVSVRDNGKFKKLPLSKYCTMGVEETNGSYGWPIYEKRKTEGSANV